MKRILSIFALFLFLAIPLMADAKTNDYVDNEGYKLVSTNEKYFKTTNVIKKSNIEMFNNSLNENDIILSYTTEVSKEEYDNFSDKEEMQTYGSSNVVQTEYKKLTVSILENGSRYKYTAVLDWKKMPAVRSYDIIAIGFYQSVKVTNMQNETYYCLTNGNCTSETSNKPKITSVGAGTVFKLPSSTSVKSLKNTLTLYIDKNVNTTIIEQMAVADYSHAKKTISLANAQNYSVDLAGITLNGITSYYDTTPSVTTNINCNW